MDLDFVLDLHFDLNFDLDLNLVLNLDLELRELEGGSWAIFWIWELNSGNRWGGGGGRMGKPSWNTANNKHQDIDKNALEIPKDSPR